jgi:hypothetical protein
VGSEKGRAKFEAGSWKVRLFGTSLVPTHLPVFL